MPRLNLVVLRVPDLEEARTFYESCFGFVFQEHRHGNGPRHYAAEDSALVFELYPLTPTCSPTSGVRFGLVLNSTTDAVDVGGMSPEEERLVECCGTVEAMGGAVVVRPRSSPWGIRGVIRDPFGHTIEITCEAS